MMQSRPKGESGSDRQSVATRGLGGIKRFVGGHHDLVARKHRVDPGDPGAGGNAHPRAARCTGDAVRHRMPQPIADPLGLRQIGTDQDDPEFLASQSRDMVTGANHALGNVGKGLQHQIADGMAMLIIDALEEIEVEHGDATTLAIFARLGDLQIEQRIKGSQTITT